MSHSIRLAGSDDAQQVAALMIGFRDWQDRSEPSDRSFHKGVRRLLADEGTEYLLGGDPPTGVCQLRFRYGLWYATPDCWLEDLFVDESARGTGLGRALVEAAFERAREHGCARVELDVNEANTAALALYESLGFEAGAGPGARNLFMRRRL